MQIPHDKLAADVLRAIIEEFVLHEGTDYGHSDFTLDQKVEKVMTQLKQGEAVVVYNEEDETCFIRSM